MVRVLTPSSSAELPNRAIAAPPPASGTTSTGGSALSSGVLLMTAESVGSSSDREHLILRPDYKAGKPFAISSRHVTQPGLLEDEDWTTPVTPHSYAVFISWGGGGES